MYDFPWLRFSFTVAICWLFAVPPDPAHNERTRRGISFAVLTDEYAAHRSRSQLMEPSAQLGGRPLGAASPEAARGPTVSVVIPTIDEARNLPFVLPRIPHWVHEVILVDGESTDGT